MRYQDGRTTNWKGSGEYSVREQSIVDSYGKTTNPVDGLLPSTGAVITRSKCVYSPCSYIRPAPPTSTSLNKVRNVRLTGNAVTALSAPGRRLTNDAYAARLLENTNPYRPKFDVPVFVGEFLELTHLLKLVLTRASFGSDVGKAFLSVNFGWESLRRDLKQASGLLDAVSSRVREFNSLKLRGGLRRRIDLDRFAVQTDAGPNYLIYSTLLSIYGSVHTRSEYRIWGSVRWVPSYEGHFLNLEDPIPLEKTSQILNVLLNLDPRSGQAATIWELIPFSWLVDYFTNLGELFEAQRGRLFVYPTHICLSEKITSTAIALPTHCLNYPTASLGRSKTITERYERIVYPDGWIYDKVVFDSLLTSKQSITLAALLFSLQKVL